MESATRERLQREYLENRIRSAHPIELVNMLYQVAIDNLKAAIGHLKTQDRLARARAITRAEEAVDELLVALDHSVNAPFTHRLAGLYSYCLGRMIEGHAKESEQAFEEALSVLSTLAVAWKEVKERTCGVPQTGVTDAEEAGPLPSVPGRYAGYRQGSETSAPSQGWSL
jgi:flagellar biosynthetic protein FliS